jgi:hypothetical protein
MMGNSTVFLIFVNLGLKMVGARYSQEAMDRTFAFVETFYDETVSLLGELLITYSSANLETSFYAS